MAGLVFLNLLKSIAGITFPKGETISGWSQSAFQGICGSRLTNFKEIFRIFGHTSGQPAGYGD